MLARVTSSLRGWRQAALKCLLLLLLVVVHLLLHVLSLLPLL